MNTGEEYPQYWICVYVGNQKVSSGQAVNFSCPAGHGTSYALWILTPLIPRSENVQAGPVRTGPAWTS